MCALNERSPHRVRLQRRGGAQDPECALGASDGHVEAAHIREEADAPAARRAGAHAGEDDYVQLLALEAVHSLDAHL